MSTFSDIVAKMAQVAPELTNTSNASLWQRIVAVFAQVIDLIKLNIVNSESVIENAARTLRVAGKQYYITTALAFQEGDALVIVDAPTFKFGYAEIDTSKQIIKQVAINVDNQNRIIYLYACTQDPTTGLNIALTPEQLDDFTDYMNSLSPLGIALNIGSNTPSIISASKLFIRYNSSYPLTQIKAEIQNSLKTQQQMLVGESLVYINDIESALSSINGVRDAYFSGIKCDGKQPTNGYFIPQSGYYNFSNTLLDLTDVTFELVR